MNGHLDKGILRMIRNRTRTVIINNRQIIVSTRNGADFPQLNENPAARGMLQDIDPKAAQYDARVSFKESK